MSKKFMLFGLVSLFFFLISCTQPTSNLKTDKDCAQTKQTPTQTNPFKILDNSDKE